MADTKISGLTALGAAPATGDLFPIVDISDTSHAATGTTKKLTVAELFTTPTVTTSLTIGGASAEILTADGTAPLDLNITAGSATSGNNNGADLTISAGAASGAGTDGVLTLQNGVGSQIIFDSAGLSLYSPTAIYFDDQTNGLYNFSNSSTLYGILNFSGIASTSKTFTFPNTTGTMALGTGTANEIAYWSGTNTLGTLAVATYPSLTELSYVKGVTSALQTQLNAKASTALSNLASVAINTTLVSDTDATDDLGTTTVKWNNIYGVNLGATGTRFTTGWFTDLTVTNAIAGSITGTAAVATTVTVADESSDSTCWVALVTNTTGNLGVKTNSNLFFNTVTGELGAVQPIAANITGNAATVTWANEATDTTCFIGFATAASGSLAPKTNTNMTFNSNTGVATFASTVLTTTDINGGTVDGVTIGGSSAGAGTFTTISGTTITASTGFELGDGDYVGVASNERFVFNTAGTIVATGADLRVETANVGTNADSVPTLSSTSTFTNKTLTSPTINAATMTGNFNYSAVPSSDHTANGITVSAFNLGATIALMDLVYLGSSSKWLLTDADAAATAGGVLIGICLDGGVDTDTTTVVLQGLVRDDTWNWTPGAPLYIDTATPGQLTATQPSGTDDVIRVVGFAVTADVIYLNPSPDYVTHT